MRDELFSLFSKQIILEDNRQFNYSIKPYELTNSLGSIVATLQEYNFTKKGDASSPLFYKLYKTKEGNWYDFEDAKSVSEKDILRLLKLAIDAIERKEIIE